MRLLIKALITKALIAGLREEMSKEAKQGKKEVADLLDNSSHLFYLNSVNYLFFANYLR